jgi:hypothetical protein
VSDECCGKFSLSGLGSSLGSGLEYVPEFVIPGVQVNDRTVFNSEAEDIMGVSPPPHTAGALEILPDDLHGGRSCIGARIEFKPGSLSYADEGRLLGSITRVRMFEVLGQEQLRAQENSVSDVLAAEDCFSTPGPGGLRSHLDATTEFRRGACQLHDHSRVR